MIRMNAKDAVTATLAAFFALSTAAPAFAQAPSGGGGGAGQLLFFGQLIAVFAIMYFLLIRPQQQKQNAIKKMQSALKKGDRVITQAGILGTVARVNDDTIVLKVGGDNELEFLRASVIGLQPEKK